MSKETKVIIVTGPTASGKTALAEQLAIALSGEIINADVGQFYTPLTIGTAKPDWRNKPFKSHLFDILDTPCDMSAAEYRRLVLACVKDIIARHKVPIIVGGSLFYLKGLMFPPHHVATKVQEGVLDLSQDTQSLWKLLQSIDPERARALHPNDRYRIERALKIWHTTGCKPSQLVPSYDPPFKALWVVMQLPRELLNQRINERTHKMLEHDGWIDEAKALINTPWEAFVQQKGLIGYTELLAWLKQPSSKQSIIEIGELICQRTRQYAKRQMIFLKKLLTDLEQHCNLNFYQQDFVVVSNDALDDVFGVIDRFKH